MEHQHLRVKATEYAGLISNYLLFFASIIFTINLNIAIAVGYDIFCPDSNKLI